MSGRHILCSEIHVGPTCRYRPIAGSIAQKFKARTKIILIN